jgi:hypothetical protein
MYPDCKDAYADKAYNIPQAHPSYKPDLDADHDGIACEQAVEGGVDLKDWHPTTSTSASTSPTALPVTGSDGLVTGYVTAAVFLLFGGVALVLMTLRRYRGAHR